MRRETDGLGRSRPIHRWCEERIVLEQLFALIKFEIDTRWRVRRHDEDVAVCACEAQRDLRWKKQMVWW